MKVDIKYFVFRYFTYAFIAFEVIILPILLSKNSYGEIEFYKSIATLGPYALLGAFSGYMYDKYTLKNESYEHMFFWGAISSFIGGVFFAIWNNNILIIVPFVLNAVSIIQEKKMQVSGNFFLSILFKPILSFFLVIIIGVKYYFLEGYGGVLDSLVIAYILSYASWTILCIKKTNISLIFLNIRDYSSSFKIYLTLINKGFIINLSTILLSFLIFNYRVFINNHFSNDLSSFSLAFNFAQFVFLGVNTIGYMLTVEIGERIDVIDIAFLKSALLKSFLFFLLLFFGGLVVALFYDAYVKHFDNLIIYYVILCLFIGIYYVASVVSPVLLYRDTIKSSTIMLSAIFAIDYYSTFFLVKSNYSSLFILNKSGILLSLSAIYNLYLIFYKSRISR
ncbi:MAG: hypothetical protein J0L83_07070 [Chitinophagales bacterium]|nr:hypothetical protein [Chitinophagales bacterium]